MTPALLDYAKTDPGFQQFMDFYNRVTASPEIQQEYVNWVKHFMREDGVRLAALEEGLEKGRVEGLEKGLEEGRVEGREKGREEGRVEEREKWVTLMEEMQAEIAKLNAQIAAKR
jgi:flagellar biosynthesis/type III secretory pathway protein FliH